MVKIKGTGCCFMQGAAPDGRPLMEVAMAGELLGDYWSEAELAKEINKSLRTIRKWRERRVGPPVTMIGKTPVYSKPGSRDWLKSLERQPVRKRTSRA
jgi:hypothetical protein